MFEHVVVWICRKYYAEASFFFYKGRKSESQRLPSGRVIAVLLDCKTYYYHQYFVSKNELIAKMHQTFEH